MHSERSSVRAMSTRRRRCADVNGGRKKKRGTNGGKGQFPAAGIDNKRARTARSMNNNTSYNRFKVEDD